MFAYEASGITLTSSWLLQAKITSHDYCTMTTFAPVTARDTGHVNYYKPIKLSKLLESHSIICVYGRLSHSW